MSRTLIIAGLLAALPALDAGGQEVRLTEESYPSIRSALLLNAQESHWQQIEWHPDLGEGIRVACEAGNPILLWMMNGHPCGMT